MTGFVSPIPIIPISTMRENIEEMNENTNMPANVAKNVLKKSFIANRFEVYAKAQSLQK